MPTNTFNVKRFAQVVRYLWWRGWQRPLLSFGVSLSVWYAFLWMLSEGDSMEYGSTLWGLGLLIYSQLLAVRMFNKGLPALLSLPAGAAEKVLATHVVQVAAPFVAAFLGILAAQALYACLADVEWRVGELMPAQLTNRPEYQWASVASALLSHVVFCLAGIVCHRAKWLMAFLVQCAALGFLLQEGWELMQRYNTPEYVVHLDRLFWWAAALQGVAAALLAWLCVVLFRRLQAVPGRFINV